MMELRVKEPKTFSCLVKKKIAKITEQRPCKAFTFKSQFSRSKENRRLIINKALFGSNGKSGPDFAYFKCLKEGCNVRAKISHKNLENGGEQDAFTNGYHEHSLPERKEIRLENGTRNREVLFVDTALEVQRSNTSVSTNVSVDPFLDDPPAEDRVDSSEEPGISKIIPKEFLETMLDTHILFPDETQRFEKMAIA